ncbi:hypothetical protein MMC31_005741 [Peltigera leucophlebia]|nr:hypothetical protein [Peltigera leucophlebia]
MPRPELKYTQQPVIQRGAVLAPNSAPTTGKEAKTANRKDVKSGPGKGAVAADDDSETRRRTTVEERRETTTPQTPSCLRRQASWLDDLRPAPVWIDLVKSKSTYLANFDWSKTFWNPLNGSETMNVLAMKGPGGGPRSCTSLDDWET